MAHRGGATLDNEKELSHQEAIHGDGDSSDRKSGPYLTLFHCPQSGDIIRQGRGDDVPAESRERRLHCHSRAEHGAVADINVPTRAGSDYTNATAIINEKYQDAEEGTGSLADGIRKNASSKRPG